MKKFVITLIVILLLIGCNNSNNTDGNTKNKGLTKEQVLYLMSGVWVNEYNISIEIDLMQEKPFRTDQWGNKYYFQILAFDLENLTVVAKELSEKEGDMGVTLRLVKLQGDSYALAWKYDKGKLLLCNFVRKLDRFMEK